MLETKTKFSPPDRVVRIAEAERISGYSDVHLRRLEAKNEFPSRFKLAANSGPYGAAGWRLRDIQAWLERRAATVDEPDEASVAAHAELIAEVDAKKVAEHDADDESEADGEVA